mmetsp:Transcript_24433/g.60329  ORF Transcript_24433/g.60329 Transcript_24433/m.60329 type:complete len:98 (+) Transcript_24433:1927-2220(+)
MQSTITCSQAAHQSIALTDSLTHFTYPPDRHPQCSSVCGVSTQHNVPPLAASRPARLSALAPCPVFFSKDELSRVPSMSVCLSACVCLAVLMCLRYR